MEQVCWDPDCAGNFLPAAPAGDAHCVYCEAPLADGAGHLLLRGALPFVDGAAATTVADALDGLRDRRSVDVGEVTATWVEDQLLVARVSGLEEDFRLLDAEVVEATGAERLYDLMALMGTAAGA